MQSKTSTSKPTLSFKMANLFVLLNAHYGKWCLKYQALSRLSASVTIKCKARQITCIHDTKHNTCKWHDLAGQSIMLII